MSHGDDGPTDERGPGDRDEGAESDSAVGSDSQSEDSPDSGSAADPEDPPEAATDVEPTDGEYVVPTETESDAETAWRRTLAETGELTPDAVDAMVSIHGERGARAVEAVSEGRVKRYRDFTVVVGHEDEYVVEDSGCTCKDSSYNLDPDDPHERCWHVLAVAIAERIGEVDHHEMWYSEVRDFL